MLNFTITDRAALQLSCHSNDYHQINQSIKAFWRYITRNTNFIMLKSLMSKSHWTGYWGYWLLSAIRWNYTMDQVY